MAYSDNGLSSSSGAISHRWLRWRRSSLVSGSLVYLGSNVLNGLIPFALLPILTRFLTPQEYGEVAMFHVLLSGLIGVVGLSVAGAAGRKYYDGGGTTEDLRQFIASCLQILVINTLIVLLLVIALGERLVVWLGLDFHWIIWGVIVALASTVVQIRLSQWQVRKKALRYGALQVGQGTLNFLLSLFLVVGLLLGAAGRIWAQIGSALFFALLALYFLRRDGLLSSWSWRSGYVIEALQFGVPLIPHVLGGLLLLQVDRIVINQELGLASAGIYMVAFQLSSAVMLIFSSINNAYVPWLFERLKRDNSDEKREIVRYTYLWFVIILSGAALSFVIGPPLIVWIAGAAYAEAGDIIGWLVLGQVFGGMYLMVTNFIFYSKRTGALAIATMAAGMVNVFLLLLLVPAQGISGAATAFVLAMALRFLLTWIIACNRHPMPWFSNKRVV